MLSDFNRGQNHLPESFKTTAKDIYAARTAHAIYVRERDLIQPQLVVVDIESRSASVMALHFQDPLHGVNHMR